MSVSRKDFRGNLRGACAEHEDCFVYEWLPDLSYNCIYCGCLPVHHKKIDAMELPVIIDQSRSEAKIAGSSKESISKRSSESQESYHNSLPQAVQESNILPSTSHTLRAQVNFISRQRHNCIQCEQQVTLDYLIPDVFRPNLMKSINTGLIDYKEQSEIIRTVASNMIQHEKTNKDQVIEVAVALVKKIPSLKGEFGSEYVGLEKALRDCIKRQKVKKKKDSQNQFSDSDWQTEQLDLMEREARKGKECSKDILKRTLQQTRECRSKDKKKLTAGQMIGKYSAFKVAGMLLWEFSDSYNIPITTLRRNWLDALPKILTILPSTSTIDVDRQTVHVLLNLPKQFHIKNKENRKDLLTVYKVGTPLESIIPEKKEPPCLSAVGNVSDEDLNLFGYVDGIAMFCNKPVESLLEMIAIYWIFDIKFHQTQKQPLLFLSACLFRKDSSKLLGQSLAKALSVTKLLSKVNLS